MCFMVVFRACGNLSVPQIPQTVPARDSQDPPRDKVEQGNPELEESEPHQDPSCMPVAKSSRSADCESTAPVSRYL